MKNAQKNAASAPASSRGFALIAPASAFAHAAAPRSSLTPGAATSARTPSRSQRVAQRRRTRLLSPCTSQTGGLPGQRRIPAPQVSLVAMRGEAAERVHACGDADRRAVDADFVPAIDDRAAERALGLETA